MEIFTDIKAKKANKESYKPYWSVSSTVCCLEQLKDAFRIIPKQWNQR